MNELKQWGGIAFIVLYYFLVVRHYEALTMAPPVHSRSVEVLEDSPLCLCRYVSLPNCFLAFYCVNARNAQTLEKTGMLSSYWRGAFASLLCLPCALWWFQNAVRTALGARTMDPCVNCCYSCCFPWCVVAQHAEALDAATGQRLESCMQVGRDPWASKRFDAEEQGLLSSPVCDAMYGDKDAKPIEV
eukprot:gb/GFBE01018215.1/.p1 GENE.gb/GFBE01018215.1/~~gb/GFBE01018215.1/.p1  ORF type:complete len:188 (+),score=26.53 gb/GFBE01018215.1/:1-564(+)